MRINILFFGPNMAYSQLTGFRGSNFDRFILGLYMFYWYCNVNWHIKNLPKRWLCAFKEYIYILPEIINKTYESFLFNKTCFKYKPRNVLKVILQFHKHTVKLKMEKC